MMFKCKKKSKRGFWMFAVILAIISMASFVYADAGPSRFSNNQNTHTYICTNTDSVANASTNISTATLTVLYHRILGFSISEYNSALNAGREAALYDCAAGGEATTVLMDEGESSDDVPFSRWYPYPMNITTQLTVRQGPNTVVAIFYEDKREI